MNSEATLEFLIHGLKYVFPADLGPIERGIPTAFSEKNIMKKIPVTKPSIYVWPFAEGTAKGISISPLFENAPTAVKIDEKLHKLLALVDILRIGRVRETKFAEMELKKEILS